MSYTFTQTGSEIQAILDRAETGGQLDQDIAAKQDALTFDAVPTEGSTNPAESGGIYDAIQAGGAAALAAFATDSVSGDVVSVPDGADGIPVKSFSGTIVPQQSGSGDPAPDNIRPISGWTGANITRAGRNLFNPHPNHNVNAQGEYIAAGSQYWATDYIPIGDTKSVVVSVADLGGMTDGSIVRVAYASDGTATSTNVGYFDHYTTPWTFTLADNIVGLRFRGYRSGGASPITGAKIQAEFGSSATTYEAYNGSTILLSFGQTVYAGTLTALGGGLWKIQPTMGVLNLASKTFVRQSGSSIASPYFDTPMTGLNIADRANAVCNMYRYSTPNTGDAEESVFGFTSTGTYLRIRDNRYSTAADFMANAIPSCVIIYPLATLPDPITITASDLQTLLGANTVWLDCGSVTGMTYRADTALYIQKLIGGGGTLSTLSMASPSPSLSLGRVGVLAEPEVSEPEQTEEEAEQTEQAEEE